MKKVYLDYGATTPVHPNVVEAMLPFFTEHFGNASAIHDFGIRARAAVEEARSRAARFLGAGEDSIVFTGSGTESNNLAILGYIMNVLPRRPHIITSAIEHASVITTCRFLESNGAEVTYLPVDARGLVSPEHFERAIRTATALISIHYANNEIGAIQPVREIAAIAERHGVVFHTDAVQAFGKLPLNATDENITLLSASAHKIYGPKGVGLLCIDRRTLSERLQR
ncbi:MAG: cysteine desulfurase family protein, partial [Pseudomonadota bacterium]